MKKVLALITIFAVLLGALASCAEANTTETTATTITTATTATTVVTATSDTHTASPVPAANQVMKITNKAEYEVLEVYGYDNIIIGKRQNDILAWELPKKVTEVTLDESGEMDAETKAMILQEYNADVTELSLAPIRAAIDARSEYNYEEFPAFEETECEIGFMEISEGKFAVEYKMVFYVTIKSAPEDIAPPEDIFDDIEIYSMYESRHFVIYLN